jgi:putative ABC transport system permease protein
MLKLVSSVIVVIAIAGPYLRNRYPELHRRLTHAREKGGEDNA